MAFTQKGSAEVMCLMDSIDIQQQIFCLFL